MTEPKRDVIDAFDDINQCIEILQLVALSMKSFDWEQDDFKLAGNVINMMVGRIETASDDIQWALKRPHQR